MRTILNNHYPGSTNLTHARVGTYGFNISIGHNGHQFDGSTDDIAGAIGRAITTA